MSNHIPAITIFIIGILPVPYTIALAGVDTGNMKAQDAAKVVGINSNNR